MTTIAFYGSINTESSETISRLLRAWAKTDALQITVGRVGVEVVHKIEGFYFYCHEAGTGPTIAPFYLLEGDVTGTLEEARERLQELRGLCEDHKIAGQFEYVEVDENGDEVSEQFSVT